MQRDGGIEGSALAFYFAGAEEGQEKTDADFGRLGLVFPIQAVTLAFSRAAWLLRNLASLGATTTWQ